MKKQTIIISLVVFVFIATIVVVMYILSTRDQGFSKGVLAVNTNKSVYNLNENVQFGLGSINEKGDTLCQSNLKLIIETPSGQKTELSTQDKSITNSPTCSEDNNVTNEPDYRALFTPVEEGIYKVVLVNVENDKQHETQFKVDSQEQYSVERSGATRINPFKSGRYPMTLSVKAKQNFKGQIVEQIPGSFNVVWQGQSKVATFNNVKTITWEVDLKAGETKELIYEYQAPKVSPEYYVMGPLIMAQSDQSIKFEENRVWQIASDATRTWDGGDADDNNVSSADNWDGSAPVAGDNLIFTGSTRTSPVFDVAINYGSITVSADNFTLTVNQNVALTGGITISNATTISVASSRTLSAATGATFTAALTKTGSGALTFTGSGSGSGGVKHEAGTLNINNDSALGTGTLQVGATGGSTAVTFNANATRAITNAIDIYQNFTFTGTATLSQSSGAVTLYKTPTMTCSASVLTFGGIVDDGANTYGITKAGTGTLVLSNANTYGGTTTVSAGVLRLSDNNALPGGIGSTGGTSGLTLSGGVVELGAGDFNRGLGTGAHQVQITAAGGFSAYGANRVVNLGGASAEVVWNSGSFVPTGSALILSSAVANYMVTFENPIDLAGAVRTIQIDNGSAATDAVMSGILRSTNGGLTKTGAGELELTGANTFTGRTTISAGTIRVSSLNSVSNPTPAANSNLGVPSNSSNGAIYIGNGTSTGTLIYTGTGETTDRVINLSGTSGGATLDQSGASGELLLTSSFTATGNGNKTLTIQGSTSGTGRIDGAIVNSTGTTAITKAGTGKWTLYGNSTCSGIPTLSAGTLVLGHNNALGSGTFAITGGTLQATGGPIIIPNTTALGGTLIVSGSESIEFSGTFTQTGSRTITSSLDSGDTFTISNTLNLSNGSTSRTLTINGTGTTIISAAVNNGGTSTTGAVTINSANAIVTLSGTNTYDGATTLTSGTLTLSGNSDGCAGGLTLTAGTLNINGTNALPMGTLALNGGTIDNNSGGSITNAQNNAITWGGTLIYGGTQDLNMGSGAITNAGSRTLTLNGTNRTLTFAGTMTNTVAGTQTTTVNENGSGNIFTLGAYNLSNSSTSRTGVFAGTGTVKITGVIANGSTSTTGNLTYSGTGTLILQGTNTYGGVTTVSTGTLLIDTNAPSSSNGALGNASSEVVLGVAGGNTNASILIDGAFTVGRIIRIPTNNTTDTGTRVLTLGGSTADNSVFSGAIYLGTNSQAGRGVTLTDVAGGQTTFSGVIQNPTSMDATTYTVTKAGEGTVVYSEANTYTGNTSVSAGTLDLGINNGFVSATTSVSAGAVLDLSGYNLTSAGSTSFTSNGTIKLFGGETVSNTPTNNTNSLVQYYGTSGPYSIKSWTYYNIQLSSASTTTYNSPTNFTATHNLTIDSSNTFDASGATTVNVDGKITNNGVLIAPSATTASAFTLGGDFENNSTFTHSSGRITLDGNGGANNQTLSGSTGTNTFYQLYITAGGTRTVYFTDSIVYAIADNGTVSFQGTSSYQLTVTRTGSTDHWDLSVSNTGTTIDVDYTTAAWSNATTKTMDVSGGTGNVNGLNTINWVFTSAGITISGVIYQTNESSPYLCSSSGNLTVYLRVNNSGSYSATCIDNTGEWSVSGITASSGNTIVAYLSGGSVRASTVLITDNTTQTNVPIIDSRVVLRDDVNSSITNAEILTGNTSDSDDLITTSGTDIAIASTYETHIYTGDTFAPGNNVNTGKLHIVGNYTGNTETLTLTGSGTGTARPLYVNGGTFTAPTTTTFTGTADTDIESTTFTDLNFTPTITTPVAYTFLGAETINGNFIMRPISSGSNALTVRLGGTTTIAAAKTLTISGTTSGTSNLDTVSGSSYALSAGLLLIEGAGTLTARNSTITLTGSSGTIFNRTGAFDVSLGTSTVVFSQTTGATTLTSGAITFDNLTVNMSGRVGTLGNAITVNDTLTITAGTLDTSSSNHTVTAKDVSIGASGTFYGRNSTINVTGNWSNSGTYTYATSTVNLNGSGAQQVSGTTTFYNFSATTNSARTITFIGKSITNIADNGTLTLTGILNNRLTLQSDGADVWYLRVSETGTTVSVGYVNASKSFAGGYKQINASNGTSTDGGNNINWLFASSGVSTTDFSGVNLKGVNVN